MFWDIYLGQKIQVCDLVVLIKVHQYLGHLHEQITWKRSCFYISLYQTT